MQWIQSHWHGQHMLLHKRNKNIDKKIRKNDQNINSHVIYLWHFCEYLFRVLFCSYIKISCHCKPFNQESLRYSYVIDHNQMLIYSKKQLSKYIIYAFKANAISFLKMMFNVHVYNISTICVWKYVCWWYPNKCY